MSLVSWLKSFFKVEEEVEYEKVRTKDCKGRFVADDPDTPENEAWTKTPAPKKKKAKKKPAAKKKKAKK
tara:strand:- start:642 stop:848 length:207 start_codon:yes stop_codon:yes gene_type:complete